MQRALPTLVADRTIQWMGGQQILDDRLPTFNCRAAENPDLPAFADLGRAGGFEIGPELDDRCSLLGENRLSGGSVAGRAADLHQAHAAHPDRLQLRVITEHRDVDAHPLRGIDEQSPGRGADLRTFNREPDTAGAHRPFTAWISKSVPNRSIPDVTASAAKSPRAHRHLPRIPLPTLCSSSISSDRASPPIRRPRMCFIQ